jgi:hypothetical protein
MNLVVDASKAKCMKSSNEEFLLSWGLSKDLQSFLKRSGDIWYKKR